MHINPQRWSVIFIAFALLFSLSPHRAGGQSTSGVVTGTVTDSSGAVIPGAHVTLENPVSGFKRAQTTDAAGGFAFRNLPFNPYRITVVQDGFVSQTQQVQVSTPVAVALPVTLQVGSTNTTVTVEAPVDLTENDPNFHTDIDRTLIDRLPVESATSQLSAIVTQTSPGVAADANGLLHGLGDHNQTSFNVDGQPITDQQSKIFSNELPADAVQSVEVIEGAPPAEYGDKTSLVVVVTTRSGQGVKTPTGAATLSYGSFGSANASFNMSYGGDRWGNFISASGLESGRFLDAPEFAIYHDKGNEENFFDRVDFQFTPKDTVHTDFQYTRSLFQNPNSFDTQYGFAQSGMTAGATDQRSKIETLLVAPTYTRTLGDKAVFNFSPYVRRDGYHYIPSANLLNEFGPIQQESFGQYRTLTNAGVHSDITYVIGPHNLKFGGMYAQTFLRENDTLGIVDPGFNGPAAGPSFNPVLAPYDLTRGGTPYTWHGRTDVKQLALYGEDSITAGKWLFNLGVRGDFYNGLAIQRQAEPRLGISYNVKETGTVLRLSYARTQETPFNENLVLSAKGCYDPVINGIFSVTGTCIPAPFNPGFRNEFHAGFEQSAGKHFVFSGEWITKYTHNGYDFSVLGATPLAFPIEWHNSKIPGYAASATMTDFKGLTARFVFSSVAARFFNPQVGGVGATPGSPTGLPFRIDHDERFNQTTHLEYAMPFHKSLYYSFSWRFDSGAVAGAVPCYNLTGANTSCGPTSITIGGQPGVDLHGLTYDEQFQAGLTCGGVGATQTSGFSQCLASQLTSRLVRLTAPGTQDDDRNPQRIAPRHLFDMALGDDDVHHWHGERYKLAARITAVNVTNQYALYNFLSTFSGTHYVTPRAVTAEVSFHF